ncbi:MAG: Gfo/Idh/MocA family oxidoreductase, partial [Pseudomonadota bacterium]
MANEEQKLKIVCVGAGYFAGFHYDAWKRIEQADLVASVDTNLESAKATGLNAYTDLEEMFEKETPDIL